MLAPPAPVQVVKEEQAAGAIPVDDAKKAELQRRAAAFANELAAHGHQLAGVRQKVASITSMGDKDMRASASVSNRMLDRPAAVLKAARARPAATRRPGSPARWSTCARPSPTWTRTAPT